MSRNRLLAPAALTALLLLGSCGTKPQLEPEGPYWVEADREPIPEPEYREPNLAWISTRRTLFDQGQELLDMGRNFRKLSGNPRQAVNINSYDEVPNSSWFTNRHALQPMSPAEITAGRLLTPGPDTAAGWWVFRPKVGGATPGFWIEDSRGDQYIIKFDPKGYPELATAAAAMGSRYFHVCGYNVPQETIVYWHPDSLRIREGATIKDSHGNKRPLTHDDLNAILAQVDKQPDGRIRSLASLNLGKVKGPFMYLGRREDDPNDWYPHQNRRELRGLYVVASLINHYDLKDHNSLDVYEGEAGEGFLRHYLLDFGSAFGSDGNGEKPPIKGYANVFDLRDVGVSLLTLGLKGWGWEKAKPATYRSVGYFESEIFEPQKFDCIIPNPAFENMTDRDAYWGAKLVMAWRDADLQALVEAGQYSDSAAAAYLLQTLIERRDKIGRYWFGKVNPLDYFELRNSGDGLEILFDDLAVKYGLEFDNARYRCRIRQDDELLTPVREFTGQTLSLDGSFVKLMRSRFFEQVGATDLEKQLIEIELETKRDGRGWSKPTRLWLTWRGEPEQPELLGIEHLD